VNREAGINELRTEKLEKSKGEQRSWKRRIENREAGKD